jgi:hypothetical protein
MEIMYQAEIFEYECLYQVAFIEEISDYKCLLGIMPMHFIIISKNSLARISGKGIEIQITH